MHILAASIITNEGICAEIQQIRMKRPVNKTTKKGNSIRVARLWPVKIKEDKSTTTTTTSTTKKSSYSSYDYLVRTIRVIKQLNGFRQINKNKIVSFQY